MEKREAELREELKNVNNGYVFMRSPLCLRPHFTCDVFLGVIYLIGILISTST